MAGFLDRSSKASIKTEDLARAMVFNATKKSIEGPKGTKTEWNSEPLKILKKLKVLSGNWTYDFKKDRKNIFYDKILKF